MKMSRCDRPPCPGIPLRPRLSPASGPRAPAAVLPSPCLGVCRPPSRRELRDAEERTHCRPGGSLPRGASPERSGKEQRFPGGCQGLLRGALPEPCLERAWPRGAARTAAAVGGEGRRGHCPTPPAEGVAPGTLGPSREHGRRHGCHPAGIPATRKAFSTPGGLSPPPWAAPPPGTERVPSAPGYPPAWGPVWVCTECGGLGRGVREEPADSWA